MDHKKRKDTYKRGQVRSSGWFLMMMEGQTLLPESSWQDRRGSVWHSLGVIEKTKAGYDLYVK